MFGVHTIEEFLARKQKGFFRIDVLAGRSVITVSRPGEPEVMTFCASPGHANQLRQALTDEGLTGYVEGAL
jgi:hypothetical protein